MAPSLPQLVAVLVAALFAYDPVARLLGLVDPDPSMSRQQQHQQQRQWRPSLNETLLALEHVVNGSDTVGPPPCAPDAYAVHVFSRRPLVLYLERFLTAAERRHLLDIGEPLYEPSTVTDDAGPRRDRAVRDSDVAMVPRTDTVRCVEARARRLQGWRDDAWIERLRLQRYGPGGHYDFHYDWMEPRHGYARVSSMMVWVDDGGGALVGGGTAFPLLHRPSDDARWCEFIECPAPDSDPDSGSQDAPPSSSSSSSSSWSNSATAPRQGVVFRPLVGNAVMWENFSPPDPLHGPVRGYDESWHAGLPVQAGVKVGLNIWTLGRVD